ncbi:MAG: hypothetical protein KIT80_00010 [Chitinophagaceae bacterium]|nr:hypothetical protein [Chitinophagaceae bacterium]MCW5925273.1 hypothetical protein [Chitinophagaceae bacterium]
MVKFFFIIFLVITSSLLFIFSKQKQTEKCSHEVKGTIVLSDSIDNRFVIITHDNKTLVPYGISGEVILTPSRQISLCYSVDSSRLETGSSTLPIYIEKISYFK